MRKQTKLVAVLSAAALLAIGASMTSFAASTDWRKSDDGTWQAYDKDGEQITGDWQKDGSKFFYLDDDGDMLIDEWVDDEHYVGSDGAMVVNDWRKLTTDEESDDPEDSGEAWYWFDSKGVRKENGWKKITGKNYYFNEGKMQDGWEYINSEWFYLGDVDEGWRVTSDWRYLDSWHEDTDDYSCSVLDADNEEKCDSEGWYWFGSDGKMHNATTKKQINGKYYYFNADGQMLYEWFSQDTSTTSNAVPDGMATSSEISDPGTKVTVYRANVSEEGWIADGWQELDGSNALGTVNDTAWYFFDDGKAYASSINPASSVSGTDSKTYYRLRKKTDSAKGKKFFCFDEKGQMQTGLQLINTNGTGTGKYYYFDANGYMVTGKVSDVEDANGDTYTFYFEKKNVNNGQGVTGERDGYLYNDGMRLEAQDEYEVYKVGGNDYIVSTTGRIQTSKTKVYTLDDGSKVSVKPVTADSDWTNITMTKDGVITGVTGNRTPIIQWEG